MQRPALSATAPYIAWYASHTPDATAVVEDGIAVSYRTLAADLARVVRALDGFGVRPGMMIGIEPRRERGLHLLLMLAAEIIGAPSAPVAGSELAEPASLTHRCALLLLAEPPAFVTRSAKPVPPWRLIPTDWIEGLRQAPEEAPDLELLNRAMPAEAIAGLLTTSGTTGRPKVIAMTQGRQQRLIERHLARMLEDILPHPTSLCLYRLSVRAVYLRVLGMLQHGGTVLFTQEPRAAPLMAAGMVNHAIFTVGDMERILLQASPPPEGHRLHVELFGAAVSRRLREAMRARLTDRISTRYSANETGLIADTDEDDVGTLAAGVRVRIIAADGSEQALGEPGLILAQTESMADGYVDDPALTAASFIDGWYITQDFGYLQAPDRLVVLGRADDMLNIGGVKLPAGVLEAELKQIVGVLDAVVMSVESPHAVGTLVAALEIPGGSVSAAVLGQVEAVLGRHVWHFDVLPLPWFPRTETGKPRRAELQALFLQRRASGAAGTARPV